MQGSLLMTKLSILAVAQLGNDERMYQVLKPYQE